MLSDRLARERACEQMNMFGPIRQMNLVSGARVRLGKGVLQ